MSFGYSNEKKEITLDIQAFSDHEVHKFPVFPRSKLKKVLKKNGFKLNKNWNGSGLALKVVGCQKRNRQCLNSIVDAFGKKRCVSRSLQYYYRSGVSIYHKKNRIDTRMRTQLGKSSCKSFKQLKFEVLELLNKHL
jgi:hypothetical protein